MRRGKSLVVLLMLAAFCIEATAVPKVRVVTIQQGNGMLSIGNGVGRLEWQVENPDSTSETISIRVSGDGGTTPISFSREIRLPSKSSVQGATHLFLSESGQFKVECLHRGKTIYKDSLLCKTKSMHHFGIGILNDRYDLRGYGKVQKMNGLPYRAAFISYKSGNVPEHWGHFGSLALLVLLDADFDRYSASQMRAISDYVAMGGTLLVAMPKAALAMRGTSLECLLPFQPVSIVRHDSYSELARLFGVTPWKEPEDFDQDGNPGVRPVNEMLNALPSSACRPILGRGAAPYACTRYFGRGKVIACTFNPFELCAMDERFVLPVWKFIMHNSGYVPNTQAVYDTGKANSTLQMLHGYSIPSASHVGGLLLVYLVVVLCIMLAAFLLKRQSLGWLVSCVFGVLMTVFIMMRASGIAGSKAVLSTANVSVSAWNGSRGASMNNSLILAGKDVQASAQVSSEHVFLRPQQPSGNAAHSGFSHVGSRIAEAGQLAFLEKLSMQKMRPRSILWLTSADRPGQLQYEPPLLDMRREGVRLRDWRLPDELRDRRRALLVTNAGARRLEMSGGFVRDVAMTQHLEADTVLLSIADYIAALPKKGPFLALVAPNPPGKECQFEPKAKNGESSKVYDYDIVFVEAQIAEDGVPDVIPSEMLQMQLPSDSPMRSLFSGGEWRQAPTNGINSANMPVLFHVPLEFASESPAEVRLAFSVLAPGQDVQFEPCIITCDGKKLAFSSRRGSVYTFTTDGVKVLSRLEGNIMVNIGISRSHGGMGLWDGTRTNYWKIMELSASVINRK